MHLDEAILGIVIQFLLDISGYDIPASYFLSRPPCWSCDEWHQGCECFCVFDCAYYWRVSGGGGTMAIDRRRSQSTRAQDDTVLLCYQTLVNLTYDKQYDRLSDESKDAVLKTLRKLDTVALVVMQNRAENNVVKSP